MNVGNPNLLVAMYERRAEYYRNKGNPSRARYYQERADFWGGMK